MLVFLTMKQRPCLLESKINPVRVEPCSQQYKNFLFVTIHTYIYTLFVLEIRKATVYVSKSLVLLDQKITWSSARAHKSKDLRRMWACYSLVLRCSLSALILGKSG